MESYPFDTTSLSGEMIDYYHTIYLALKARFNIQHTGEIDFQLKNFEVFRGYTDINIRGSFAVKHENSNNDFYILFLENISCTQGRYGLVYPQWYQVWVLAYLKKDFGRTLIRRETLADKIIELVHPVELDFAEDKAFSDTFYVLTNDRDKATRAIDRNFRNVVMDLRHEDFSVEILEHNLVAGTDETLPAEKVIYLAEFVERLCKMC